MYVQPHIYWYFVIQEYTIWYYFAQSYERYTYKISDEDLYLYQQYDNDNGFISGVWYHIHRHVQYYVSKRVEKKW